jgi:hypothetical protein
MQHKKVVPIFLFKYEAFIFFFRLNFKIIVKEKLKDRIWFELILMLVFISNAMVGT